MCVITGKNINHDIKLGGDYTIILFQIVTIENTVFDNRRFTLRCDVVAYA